MNRHISEQYDVELDSVRSLLLEMGGMAEQQLREACESLYNHDSEMARSVKKGDRKINRFEVDIDDLVVQIIARRQPAATDLRTLISIMNASTDLERVGDEAGRIAKMAKNISKLELPVDQYSDIRAMAEQVQTMLARALDAFARLSSESAIDVIASDNAVDDAYDEIVKEMGAEMKEHPDQVDRSLTILWVARALERCGDHAKNLSEHVVYLVKGKDVRHSDAAAIVSED